MSVTELVLTGGPHSGKSSSISYVHQKLQELGYRVLLVPDSIELVEGSFTSNLKELVEIDSELVIKLIQTQHSLRRQFQEIARVLAKDNEKIILIHSRTPMDFAPYLTDFESMLVRAGLTMRDARDSFDLVVHLMSLKNDANYQRVSNESSPTLKEARRIDKRLLKAWTGVAHLRVIKVDQTNLFEEKLKKVFTAVARVLGEPPREIEHKYLLKKVPTPTELLAMGAVPIQIEQTYLHSPEVDTEIRLRKRICGAQITYYHTHKKQLTDLVREETDRIITYREYNELLMFKDETRGTILKTRYCLVANEHYLELDLFSNPPNLALLEVEVDDPDDPIDLPDIFEIKQEVSDDPAWSNHSIAKQASL